MSSTHFVHLRLHSEFSVVDGIVRIDDAVGKAAADGQGALAITDSANVFGAVRFYQAARRKGVKPIIGCDVWITNDAERDNPYRMALLVQDHAGYLNLCTSADAGVSGEPAPQPGGTADRVVRGTTAVRCARA